MRSIKHIALSAILTLSAFCAVLYTSCSKDACKGVTCDNGGTCAGGTCTCPTGTGGTSCDVIYRSEYNNTYVGTGTDNTGATYTNFRMIFSTPGNITSTDFTTMLLTIEDETGASAGVPVLTISLNDFSGTSAAFTVQSTTSAAGYTYTGSGTISPTSASLILTETPTSGGSATTYVYTFNNFSKQ